MSIGLLASAAVMAINVATGTLLARSLGPHDRGELAAVILWPSLLAGLGSLGVSEAGAYFAARNDHPLGQLLGTTVVIVLLQAILLCSVGLAVVPTVLAGHDAATVATAVGYLAFIPLTLLSSSLLWLLNGVGQSVWFQCLRLGVYMIPAIAFAALAGQGALSVRNAAAVYLVANAAVAAAAALRLLRDTQGRPAWSGPLARQILHYGVRGHTSTVSGIFNERLDQMLISAFLAPTKLGLYVVAVTMTSATAMIGSSISMVALPAVSRASSVAAARHTVVQFVRAAIVLSVAATLPLFVVMPVVVSLFFGDAYRGSVEVARVLVVGAVFLSCARVLGSALKGLGEPLDAGLAEGGALVVTAAGLAIMMPAFGLMGAAVASLLSYVASAIWAFRRAAFRAGITPSEFLVELVRPARPAQAVVHGD
ncbi:MAG: lipopolysaccharide biosynthesis protein [Dehalococcoidia bacterium]